MYPEFDIVFIGDSGEGDLITGIMCLMFHDNCYVFIHDIKNEKNKSYLEIGQKISFQINDHEITATKLSDQFVDVEIDNITHKLIYLFDNQSKESMDDITQKISKIMNTANSPHKKNNYFLVNNN
jgi:hypothetical protein